MPGTYQTNTGTNIGALLRTVSEDEAQNPAFINPQSQIGSPLRSTVQTPLNQVEAPDSSRVVVTRPEMNTPIDAAAPQVIAPVAPNIPVEPVGPVGPATPVSNINSSNRASNSAPAPVQSAKPATKAVLASSIAPKGITTSTPTKTPSASRVGSLIAKVPETAKTYVGTKPGQNSIDKLIDSFLKKSPGNITQKLLPKLFA